MPLVKRLMDDRLPLVQMAASRCCRRGGAAARLPVPAPPPVPEPCSGARPARPLCSRFATPPKLAEPGAKLRPRCSDILQQAYLGTLTPVEQAFPRKECR